MRYVTHTLRVWLIPLALVFVLPLFWHNKLEETLFKTCFTMYILKHSFFFYILIPMMFIVFISVFVLYIPIIAIALRHLRNIHANDVSTELKQYMAQQLRILKTATIVLLPFFAGFMPWLLTASIIVYDGETYQNPGLIFKVNGYTTYPAILTSGINPFIYAARMPDFKAAFKKQLCIGMNRVTPD